MISATRLVAAAAAVTVLSNRAEVTDWALRYFGPWWNATAVGAVGVCAEAVVVADVNPDGYEAITRLVNDGRPTESVDYAKHELLVAQDGEDIVATSPSEGIAYRSTPSSGRLVLAGTDVQPLTLAAARIAREAIRGQLLRDGWAVLHSSAVVRPDDGATLLTFGDKGAGKTTTALLLASHGWQLLANDRVLVRPTGERDVEVVPWPSAAALGLGLLHSLGWDVTAREHLRNGGRFHPTQHESVTEALLAGDHTPLWENAKRERKVQVFPDQFPDLFGVPLATGGRAAGLLFPQFDADAAPDITDGSRTLGEADFMSGKTEDRYPDVFGQAQGVDGGGRESARAEVAARLAELPHRVVRLSHDVRASAAVLTKVADAL
ncbi:MULTISPECIES: hypothetical protein [unclassified Streptomyces]|uniref:hypothetical protein n=1 Tax=unclassified Streptomyces TaxID=2593676 RepID=UPI000804CC57|nr:MULTISPECIES: hypothetical protein [unclassified Streptomyces]MYR75916.1 hypothetical protein [Streptomyces sp. SID4925]SBU96966.1 hypothetical protein YUMDRAFT_05614 [Streptomyces sp. OspMP-M45]